MVATDEPGVTFNAAGLSDNTLRRLGADSPNAMREELANSGQIRRYNVEGELLTGLQQVAVPGLPDAVGRELRVAAPKGMGLDPVERHGGGGVQQSYVESLRQNEAYRPFGISPVLAFGEPILESGFNTQAAAGRNMGDVITHTGQVLGITAGEMVVTVRQEVSQGHVIPAVLRAGGDVAGGALDISAGVARESADLAGDLLMEGGTLVGNALRGLGFDAAAQRFEHAGQVANKLVDKAGTVAASALDKVGDGVEWVADKTADAARWAMDKTIAGAQWAGEKLSEGANWAAEKVGDGLRWIGQRLNPANW